MTCINICRCCLSRDCYKDINNEYYNGRQEIYSAMLFETFNIKISSYDNIRDLICEDCIPRLRDATEFKKQIQQSEETIWLKINGLENGIDFDLCASPKRQPKDKDFTDHMSHDFEDKVSDRIGDEVFDWEHDGSVKDWSGGNIYIIKLRPNEGVKSCQEMETEEAISETENSSKKMVDKDTKVDKSVCKVDEGETCTVKLKLSEGVQSCQEMVTEEATSGTEKSSKMVDSDTEAGKSECEADEVMTEATNGSPSEESEMKTASSDKDTRENSVKLILNSNMCLFNSCKEGYQCVSCPESFVHIARLREHVKTHSKYHDTVIRMKYLKRNSLIYVDISSLRCKLCSQACNDLVALREHLISSHDIKFGNGDHLLIPYKLESGFQCLICKEVFNNFLVLSIHMNSHCRNNTCDICGASYISRTSLLIHVQSVHKLKCTQCQAKFSTLSSKVKHMREQHINYNYTPEKYCSHCNKMFKYSRRLTSHNIREHDIQEQNMMDSRWRIHTCSRCEKKCTTKYHLKLHEASHVDVKPYSCSHCEARFKLHISLRRHETLQHNE